MDPAVGCNLFSVKFFTLTESRVACQSLLHRDGQLQPMATPTS